MKESYRVIKASSGIKGAALSVIMQYRKYILKNMFFIQNKRNITILMVKYI